MNERIEAVRELIASTYRQLGDEPPELSDEQIAKALKEGYNNGEAADGE
jgi:hypothetical protein